MRLTLAFAVLLGAPLVGGNGPIPPDWPSGAEGDVLESVVWYRLANNISGVALRDGRLVRKTTGEPTDVVVCLELPRTSDAAPKPAPRAFLARFARVPEIALGSECTADLAGDYETVSHRRAIIFTAGPVRWVDADTAEAPAGYHAGGLSAQWCEHELRRVLGVWVTYERGICTVS
jgi:hypothetical protein